MAYTMIQSGRHSARHHRRKRRMAWIRGIHFSMPKVPELPSVRRTKARHHKDMALNRVVAFMLTLLAVVVLVQTAPVSQAVQDYGMAGVGVILIVRFFWRLLRQPGDRHFNGVVPTAEELASGPMRILPPGHTPIDGVPLVTEQPQPRPGMKPRHKVLAAMMALAVLLDLIERHNQHGLSRSEAWARRNDERMGISPYGPDYEGPS